MKERGLLIRRRNSSRGILPLDVRRQPKGASINRKLRTLGASVVEFRLNAIAITNRLVESHEESGLIVTLLEGRHQWGQVRLLFRRQRFERSQASVAKPRG
jgi:hypothetical protein